MAADNSSLPLLDRAGQLPWMRLLNCHRVALAPAMLLLSAAGVMMMSAGWRFFSGLYSASTDPIVISARESLRSWPWQWQLLDGYDFWNALPRLTERFTATARQLFNNELTFSGWLYFVFCTLWALLVWSIVGAAVTRIAALRLTRGERIGITTAWNYGWSRWGSYWGGPGLPLLGCLLLAIPLFLAGLLIRLDLGAALVALCWPLVLCSGVAMAILMLGTLLGWPLMWPTISVEGTDCFDALSRSYSYILNRPLRYAAYLFTTALLGGAAFLLLTILVQQINTAITWGLSTGAGSERAMELVIARTAASDGVLLNTAKWLVRFWTKLPLLLPIAYAVSYFWTAAVQSYLLLRLDEDGAQPDEIFLEGDPAEFGLPTLRTDAAGVPTVDEQPRGGTEPTPPGGV